MRTHDLPAFPTGWFAIAYSADLKPGEVTTTTFCGEEVIVFRNPRARPRCSTPTARIWVRIWATAAPCPTRE